MQHAAIMIKLMNKHSWPTFICIIVIVLFSSFQVYSQRAPSYIYGIITDVKTGEAITGVSVYIKPVSMGSITNAYGVYSLRVVPGTYTILFQHSSFQTIEKAITVKNSERIDIALEPLVGLMKEVIVNSKKDLVNSSQMRRVDLKIERIKQLPSMAGEPDLFKSIQLLPGVNVANEGSSNFDVRGGGFDQNLILLDEAPVYNPSHALGFFSTFNADALRNVTFYKGAFPAQYGGRLSSVVDVNMKEGNNKVKSIDGGIGFAASRLTYQQPIKKNKSSFLLSGRYSYAGYAVNLLGNLGKKILHLKGLDNFVDRNDIYFYDFNAKVNFILSLRDKLYISAYTGRDKFYSYQVDESNSLRWGNTTATIRWNHFFSSRLFSNTSIILSNYNYSYFSLVDVKAFIWKAAIRSYGIKSDYDWFLTNRHKIKMGFSLNRNIYRPGQIKQSDTVSVIRSFTLDQKRSLEAVVYVNDEIKVGKKISAQIGLRATTFLNLGPGKVYTYNDDFTTTIDSVIYAKGTVINDYKSVEPRVSLRYLLDYNSSLKFSYAKTRQFQHLVSNSSVGLPTDVWIPADSYFKPQKADQFALGYFKNIENKGIEFSIEAYYKILKDIVDYKDNANLFLNPKLETQILSGSGNSFGAEILVDKKNGKLTGWVSYTWSNTSLKIPGINNDKQFPARYDIRNNLVITSTYAYNKRLLFAATFKLTSGGHITMPEGNFSYNGAAFNFYTSRNGYTLPAYHRLDISATLKSKEYKKHKLRKEWVFSIFNVYNRANIYALFLKPDPESINLAKAFNFYLYGVVPTISLNFSLK